MRELTDEQQIAVERRAEPLLLAAGAGSGKTSVLVERFVKAVCEDGLAPARIMALTFTDRAAGELRLRVRQRLLELGQREAARETEGAFVSTFHGFCVRLLRGHALAAGLDPQFEILDEAFSGRMMERAVALAIGDLLGGESAAATVDMLAAYGVDRVSGMVLGVHQQLRSRGEREPRLPDAFSRVREGEEITDRRAAGVCALLGNLLVAFCRRYEALKLARGALDFDDLELRARDLLVARESVRRSLSERFELLMVDEFQDTNARQLEILEQLQRENLFTVGDELQSIYGFRHADVRLFRTRRAELGGRGKSLSLTHNFRSRGPILDVVNAVFEERFGDGHTTLIAAREPGGESEPLVELLLSGTTGWSREEADEDGVPGHWRRAEAQALAERVAELIKAGYARAGEVAVLLRSSNDLDIYEQALTLEGLPTLAAVGAYWERLEVGDLLSWLRAIANPEDELALYGTLACPLVGLSADGLALLAERGRATGLGAWGAILRFAAPAGEADEADEGAGAEGQPRDALARLTGRDRHTLLRFAAYFSGERRTASRRTLSELIERAMDHNAYREQLVALAGGERRLANVHKLIRLARRFEATEGRDLRGFLDHIAYRQGSRAGAEPDAPAAAGALDAVQLMTVHAAKGLEFPVVCVADLGRGRNLPTPELLIDGDRIGLRLIGLEGPEAVPALDFADLLEESRQRDAEEEERIIYVAMTRARQRLLLSGAVRFDRWPEGERAPPISWLGPALSEELTEILATRGEGVVDLAVGAGGQGMVRLRMNTPEATRARLSGRVPRPEVALPADAHEQLQLEIIDGAGVGGGEAGAEPESSPAPASDLGSPTASDLRSPTVPDLGPLSYGPESSPAPAPDLGPLSYTALTELERCGYRYYLERVIGLGEERSGARASAGREAEGALRGRTRGILIHHLLERVDFQGGAEPGAVDLERAAAELGVSVEPDERGEIAEMVLAVSRAAEQGLEPAVRVRAARSVHTEYPFALSIGGEGPLLTGVIDLLAREPGGGVLVLDYKSDRVGEGESLEALTERDYGLQRLLYGLAVLRAGAPRVDVIHWFLRRPREWVSAHYLPGDLPALEERLQRRLAAALGDPFTVSAHPHRGLCATCPGRARLCSWTEAETLREPSAASIPSV
jgi:ATP-dependent exoDNAse (exonuclease V) beta subunit